MNEILRIKSSALPDARHAQLPLRLDIHDSPKSYPPEFWLEIPTDNQAMLIHEFEKHEMEYLIFEITDSVPLRSVAVCRWSTYQDAVQKVIEICKSLSINDYVVSDGGLTSVNINGDLQGFICFD